MTAKVLGYSRGNGKLMLRLFRDEQSKHGNKGCYCSECENDMRNALKEYDKFVPVLLASESVEIKWLEDYCKENEQSAILNVGKKFALVIPTKDLLSAVRVRARRG